MADTSHSYRESTAGFKDYHFENTYTFLDEAYHGNGGFLGRTSGDLGVNGFSENGFSGGDCKSYVIPSRNEALWQERVKRSMYVNMMEPFITAQYKLVYTEQPPVTTVVGSNGEPIEVSLYSEWLKNVDGIGSTFNQYKENCMQSSYLDAVAFCVMDKAEGEKMPIVYIQKAGTVDRSRLVVDRFGRLEQIAFVVYDSCDEDGNDILRRTTWTNQSVTVELSEGLKGGYNKDTKWSVESSQPLTVPEMPILPLFSVQRTDTRDYLPFPAKSYSIASMSTVKYNVGSERIWHIVRQALAYMWTTADIESIEDGNTSALQLNSVNGDGGAAIGYVNADTGIAENHRKAEVDVTLAIIDVMAEAGVIVTQANSEVPESGVARGYRYRGQQAKLGNTENMDLRVSEWAEKFYKYYNDPTGTWTTTTVYKGDYSFKESVSLTELIDTFEALKMTGLEETIKAVVVEIMQKVTTSPDMYERVKEEIADYIVDEDNGVAIVNE